MKAQLAIDYSYCKLAEGKIKNLKFNLRSKNDNNNRKTKEQLKIMKQRRSPIPADGYLIQSI